MSKAGSREEGELAAVVHQPTVEESIQQARRTLDLFQRAKRALLDKEDIAVIGGREYIKRSGLRKIALAMHVDTEIISREVRDEAPRPLSVIVVARASNAEGRTAEDVGTCDEDEVRQSNMKPTLHNIASRAATRALNRAIADLIGGGVLTAEEVEVAEGEAPPAPTWTKGAVRPNAPPSPTQPQQGGAETRQAPKGEAVTLDELQFALADHAGNLEIKETPYLFEITQKQAMVQSELNEITKVIENIGGQMTFDKKGGRVWHVARKY